MHSASGPSPCVRYSNVSWLARTVPLLKSCMALPPTVYASLLAPKRAPVLMDVDKVVRRHGIRFGVLASASPLARSPRPRPSFCARLRQPSTPGGGAHEPGAQPLRTQPDRERMARERYSARVGAAFGEHRVRAGPRGPGIGPAEGLGQGGTVPDVEGIAQVLEQIGARGAARVGGRSE